MSTTVIIIAVLVSLALGIAIGMSLRLSVLQHRDGEGRFESDKQPDAATTESSSAKRT